MERELAEFLLGRLGVAADSGPEYAELVASFAEIIRKRCGNPIYPKPHESLALSVRKPKTAALAFDKVYRFPILEDPVPEEVGFYCATSAEIRYMAAALFLLSTQELGIPLDLERSGENRSPAENEQQSLRLLCEELGQFGASPTIFYENRRVQGEEFPSGPSEVLTAAISNIAMVDEKELSWDQVIEFRKDKETRAKYRRFVRWVDKELSTKTPAEVEDLVATRLDDYEWALKKHGLASSLGTLSCLIDPKFLGATSATVAATAFSVDGFWAAVMAAGLTAGRALVTFGTTAINGIDTLRSTNYEIAYVHEIKKSFG